MKNKNSIKCECCGVEIIYDDSYILKLNNKLIITCTICGHQNEIDVEE